MYRRSLISAAAVLAALAPDLVRANEKPEKKKGGGESYIQIGAIIATTNVSGGSRGVLTVETGIDVPEAALRNKCEQVTPRLRAAFVQVIQIYAAGLSPGAVPNADFIGSILQRETDRVLGKKGARLLLGSIMIN